MSDLKTFYVTIYACTSRGEKLSTIPLFNQVGVRGTSKEDIQQYFDTEWINEIYEENQLFKMFPIMSAKIEKIETLEELKTSRKNDN